MKIQVQLDNGNCQGQSPGFTTIVVRFTLYIRNVQNLTLYTTLNWPCPKTSFSAALAFVKPSYGRFCSKIAQILLPWQQWSVHGKIECHH